MRDDRIAAAERMEIFAELLSEGIGITHIARQMGIPRNRANKYLARLRERLGKQAC